jgi:predicted nucleic-acid-binding Zn-ribbon protein
MDPEEELFMEAARAAYRRLKEWERKHPEATLGERNEQQARHERRTLMGQFIPAVLAERGRDDRHARPHCPKCGKRMAFQGDRSVPVETLEGCITLQRPYYYCLSCHEGLFPPGPGSPSGGPEQ